RWISSRSSMRGICSAARPACATGRRCLRPARPGRRPSWRATSSVASRTWTPTGAGCWRSSTRRLSLLQPLAEALEQLRERRVLLHLDAQVPHAGVVDRLAPAVVDSELAGAENLERLLERLRAAALARANPCGLTGTTATEANSERT